MFLNKVISYRRGLRRCSSIQTGNARALENVKSNGTDSHVFFLYPNANEERPAANIQFLHMFFSDNAKALVDRFYIAIKSYFTDFIVSDSYTDEGLNFMICSDTISFLMDEYTYKVVLCRSTDGELDHVKFYSKSTDELYSMLRTFGTTYNFLGVSISQITMCDGYLLIKLSY